MKILRRIIVPLVVVMAILIAAMASSDKRYISSGIFLKPLAEQERYILNFNDRENRGSILEGTVSEVGWNAEEIVCNVKKHYTNLQDGLYVINKKTKEITGPKEKDYPEKNEIEMHPVEEAYNSLYFFPVFWK